MIKKLFAKLTSSWDRMPKPGASSGTAERFLEDSQRETNLAKEREQQQRENARERMHDQVAPNPQENLNEKLN